MKHSQQNEQPKAEQPTIPNNSPAPSFESALAGLTLTPKQSASLTALLAAILTLRGDTCKVTNPIISDRNLIVLVNGSRVSIGPGGGFNALDVRTYPKADLTTMANADLLHAKQTGRDVAKAATAAAAVVATAAANKVAAPLVDAANQQGITIQQ